MPFAPIQRYREGALGETSMLAVNAADHASEPRERGIKGENVVMPPPERITLGGKGT